MTILTAKRIRLNSIEPFRCWRPHLVPAYVVMLRDELKAPPILIERVARHRYRIFDGMHRTRAAIRAGRKTIQPRIIVDYA